MEGQYRKRCLGFAQQHDAAVPGELWCQPLDKRNEARVYKEEAVRRMVHNVHDLVIEQPRVDGVTDGAYTRDAVIQLEMPEGIPGEGAYSVTGLDPEPQQRAGEPAWIGARPRRRCSDGSFLRRFARQSRCHDDRLLRGRGSTI